jgi:hypothetical protein
LDKFLEIWQKLYDVDKHSQCARNVCLESSGKLAENWKITPLSISKARELLAYVNVHSPLIQFPMYHSMTTTTSLPCQNSSGKQQESRCVATDGTGNKVPAVARVPCKLCGHNYSFPPSIQTTLPSFINKPSGLLHTKDSFEDHSQGQNHRQNSANFAHDKLVLSNSLGQLKPLSTTRRDQEFLQISISDFKRRKPITPKAKILPFAFETLPEVVLGFS